MGKKAKKGEEKTETVKCRGIEGDIESAPLVGHRPSHTRSNSLSSFSLTHLEMHHTAIPLTLSTALVTITETAVTFPGGPPAPHIMENKDVQVSQFVGARPAGKPKRGVVATAGKISYRGTTVQNSTSSKSLLPEPPCMSRHLHSHGLASLTDASYLHRCAVMSYHHRADTGLPLRLLINPPSDRVLATILYLTDIFEGIW